MQLSTKQINEEKLKKNGYIFGKLKNKKIILRIKDNLEVKLKQILKLKKKIRLEQYHKLDLSREEHFKVQWLLSNHFIKNKFHNKIVYELLDTLKYLIGPDLLIQKKPYIRIARPNNLEDNIGFHKDTMYGQSTYEMSVHTPLVNLNSKSCLKFVPFSHMFNEKKIKLNKNLININNKVKKNSYLHKLGFPYDPKRIDITNFSPKNFNVKLGEYVLFSPALIHGQEINKDKSTTRFSFDTRITNVYSPINLENRGANGKYDNFNISAITTLSNDYIKSQN